MEEFLSELLKARPDTLLIVGGLFLLLLAIAGNISDKIKAGKEGRIAAALIGPVLLVAGITMHAGHGKRQAEDGSRAVQDRGQIPGVEAAERSGAKKSNNGTKDCSSSPDMCRQGYVWREAVPHDHVCVTPEIRSQTHADNTMAATRRNPSGGSYGADTCLPGFVWRDAFDGDHVCVTPDARNQAAQDNSMSRERDACS